MSMTFFRRAVAGVVVAAVVTIGSLVTGTVSAAAAAQPSAAGHSATWTIVDLGHWKHPDCGVCVL